MPQALSKAGTMPDLHTTGIYRCYILDLDMNFARIPNRQEPARINAFLCYIHIPPRTPRTGALLCGLPCKCNNFPTPAP